MGHFSSGGVTFVGEFFSAFLIDFEYTEKCFKCVDCNDFTTNGTCEYGLFHGDAGQMEIHNAMILFKRSESRGFQYTTMIADGDNNVYLYIKKHPVALKFVNLFDQKCRHFCGFSSS